MFISGLWCGIERYAHLDITRLDGSLQHLYGRKRMPEHKAFERYFRKFDMPTNHAVFGGLYRWLFNNLITLHLIYDSSVLTRYGEQQGARKGYNRHKPGRKSHHSLLAFVADVEMIANLWLRSGDAHTSNNFQAFLEETLSFFVKRKSVYYVWIQASIAKVFLSTLKTGRFPLITSRQFPCMCLFNARLPHSESG